MISSASRRISVAAILMALLGLTLGSCSRDPSSGETVPNEVSLRFDGDDDSVDLGTIASGNPLMLAHSPFTLSAWFRQERKGDHYQRIIDKSDEALGRNGWALGADPGERQIHFYVHNGTDGFDFVSKKGYPADRWHHVAAVARPDTVEIWIDGEKDRGAWFEGGSHTLPPDVTTTARLGTWNHSDQREWRGNLDEIAVWNADLDDDAIRAVYRSRGRTDLREDRGPYQSSRHLVGYWRLGDGPEEGLGSSVQDLSPIGNHGTLMPAPGSGNAPRFVRETPH